MFRFFLSLIWLYLCLGPLASAQSFPQDPSEDRFLFNPKQIKAQSIQRIQSVMSYKYDLKPIVFTKEKNVYKFNEEGYVNEIIRIKQFGSRLDSIQSNYFYDQKGNLTSIVKNDIKYTYVDLMEYESSEMVKHEFYQMKKTSTWNEQLTEKYLMWSDSIIKDEHKCEVYNVFGRKYRTHIIVQRQDVISQIRTFDQGGKLMKTSNYIYENGHLIEMEEISPQELMFSWKKTFEYSDDLLVEVKYYKEEKLEYIQKISYNNDQIPELDLKRNEHSKKMSILKITIDQ